MGKSKDKQRCKNLRADLVEARRLESTYWATLKHRKLRRKDLARKYNMTEQQLTEAINQLRRHNV